MLNPIKLKAKKILTNKNNNADDDDNNVSKVTVGKRELKRPKCVKSNLGFKVSVVEMRNKSLGTRKKSWKMINNKRTEECSILQKSRNHAFKKSELLATPSKTLTISQSRKKFNPPPTSNLRNVYQKYISQKNSSLTPIKYSEDSKKTKNPSLIFVSLNNMDDEKRYKHKNRKPANASELQRLREKLWKKSSYHKRFLGKSDSIKPKKNKKNKNDVAPRRTESLSSKRIDLRLHKSDVKIMANKNKIFEQNMILKSELDENDFDIEEDNINLEMGSFNSLESLKEDVSMVDENYIKSLLCIANCNTEQKNLNVKQQHKEPSVKNDNKTQASEKEFFISKKKNKKINQKFNFNVGNSKTDFLSLPDSFDIKSQRNSSKEVSRSTNVVRDATKSETQLRICKRKTSDTKSKEVKIRKKKAYSKHEINGNRQKTKTRNIRKNKKEGTLEMPLPSEVLKTEIVQELWRRENVGKLQNSQSSDLSVTGPEDHNNENMKGLGIESYQILKRFVEEEVYRISHKINKNSSEEKESKIKKGMEMENQEAGKEQSAVFCDKEFPCSLRKKISKKAKKTFLQDELQLQNAETFNLVKVLQKEKPETAKSKLKLSGEKKTPDEAIKNWSIVNRLEQAFLALGTPDFRTRKIKEPTATNAKGMQTNERNVTEVKRTEKKEKKSLMPRPINKQKDTETSKSLLNEKQLNVLHKKESTSSNRKLVARSSGHSAKSYKDDGKTKPKEEKIRPQPSSSPRPIKPTPKPTAIPAFKSGIKPPTKIGFGLQNKVQGSRQVGKFGKKNSCRPNLCESSAQIKNDDDNLERKKTFHIISLKDSIIMQPRRSKSCNKIEGNTEMNRVHGASSTGSKECQNLDALNRHEQNLDFWEFFNKIEKTRAEEELKNKSNKTEQNNILNAPENVKSKDKVQIYEKPKISAEKESLTVAQEKDFSQESKREQGVSTEFSKDIGETKAVVNESKVRSIKERSILSIRTSKTENRISHTNTSHTQDKYTPKVTVPKAFKKEDVFLPPIPSHSESSLISTGTYDIPEQRTKSFAKVMPQTVTWNDGLELLKPPSAFSSKSIQIVSSKMSTHEKPEAKTIRTAPWEQDIKQYRALVREIMSQYKRIDGFLKQSENLKTFMSEDLKKPSKSSEINNFSGELNIHEYRRKIIMEYQQLPILEYKSKLQKTEEKVSGKRKNLLVVHPADAEADLDVKDYEPSMKTVLGSHLYVDQENLTKRNEVYKNRKEKKSSLQEVTLYKSRNGENSNAIVSTPKSCLSYSEQMPQNILTGENLGEKNFSNSKPNPFLNSCKV